MTSLLTPKPGGTVCSVALDLYDLPADTLRDKYFTPAVPSDGFNTFFPKNKFLFEKVVLYMRVIDLSLPLDNKAGICHAPHPRAQSVWGRDGTAIFASAQNPAW